MLCAVGLAGEHKQAEVQAARTAGDMWKAIGKDSWVVVPIASTSRPGITTHCLTRLTPVAVSMVSVGDLTRHGHKA